MTTAVMIAAAVADGLAFALLLFSSVRLIGGLEGTTVGRRAVNMLYPLSQMAFIGYNMVTWRRPRGRCCTGSDGRDSNSSCTPSVGISGCCAVSWTRRWPWTR